MIGVKVRSGPGRYGPGNITTAPLLSQYRVTLLEAMVLWLQIL